MIQWTYDAMYKWYAKQEQIMESSSNDVYTFVYDTLKPSMKNKGKVEPFITPNMVCLGKSPIQNERFPNGLYTVVERNTENTKKKWLFFVYPEEKECNDTRVLFANHLSFCLDTSDKTKPVHFHSTPYICTIIQDTVVYGNLRVNDYFPDKLSIPREGTMDNIITDAIHRLIKPTILDLMRYPWTSIGGGSKRGGTRKTAKQSVARPIISPNFCDMWSRCEFKGMVAFGIPRGSKIVWTVRFIRRIGEKARGRIHRAYVFTTNSADEQVFQETLFTTANLNENP